VTDDDWTVLEDDIADAIDDSMDMDWNGRWGARAIIEMLRSQGYRIEMPKGSTND
jgi:hypothetical protein